jgi:hypothetical protein
MNKIRPTVEAIARGIYSRHTDDAQKHFIFVFKTAEDV